MSKNRQNIHHNGKFPVHLSHSDFPMDMETYEKLGMPLGCTVVPFIFDENSTLNKNNENHISNIARCFSCLAYINKFCSCTPSRWICSLCGSRNLFSRNMARYRQDEFHLLPELKSVMNDFSASFRQRDISEINRLEKSDELAHYKPVDSSSRPLVHIFVVQESMPIDTMDAVIESLTATIQMLHPDIYIILLTYSHRIGVYHFNQISSSSVSNKPVIQYIHFQNIKNNDVSLTNILPKDQIFSGTLFDGQEYGRFFETCTTSFQTQLMVSLSVACDFFEIITNVGNYRDSILSAIRELDNTFESLDEATGAPGISNINPYRLPQNLIGPTIEAISQWISQPCVDVSSIETLENMVSPMKNVNTSQECTTKKTSSHSLLNMINDAITNISVSLVGNDSDENIESNSLGSANPKPYDICSGIIINLFFSNPQDLPPKAHISCPAAIPLHYRLLKEPSASQLKVSNGAGWAIGIDKAWTKNIADGFSYHGVSVNLWSLSSFKLSHTDLKDLSELSLATGGEIYRCILGTKPQDEKLRFKEKLTRTICRPIATKCILKVRASNILEIVPKGILGPIKEDKKLPDIYHMAACSHHTTISVQLGYKEVEEFYLPKENDNSVVIQFAFEYETLVEDSSKFDKFVQNINKFHQEANIKQSITKIDPIMNAITSEFNLSDEYENYIKYKQNNLSKENMTKCNSKGAFYKSKDESTYDHSKRLLVVRKIRVISLFIGCSSNISYLVRGSDVSVISTLLARQAFLLDCDTEFDYASNNPANVYPVPPQTPSSSSKSKKKSKHDAEQQYNQLSHGIRFTIEWTTSIVYSGLVYIRSTHTADLKKLGSSSNHNENLMAHEHDEYWIEFVFKIHELSQLFKVTLGLINMLIECNDESQLDGGDFAYEMIFLINSSEPKVVKKFFYPEFHSLDKHNIIQSYNYPLPLKQESILMASLNKTLLNRDSSIGSNLSGQSGKNSYKNTSLLTERGIQTDRSIQTDRTVDNDHEVIPAFFLDCGYQYIFYKTLKSFGPRLSPAGQPRMSFNTDSITGSPVHTSPSVGDDSPRSIKSKRLSSLTLIDSSNVSSYRETIEVINTVLPRPTAIHRMVSGSEKKLEPLNEYETYDMLDTIDLDDDNSIQKSQEELKNEINDVNNSFLDDSSDNVYKYSSNDADNDNDNEYNLIHRISSTPILQSSPLTNLPPMMKSVSVTTFANSLKEDINTNINISRDINSSFNYQSPSKNDSQNPSLHLNLLRLSQPSDSILFPTNQYEDEDEDGSNSVSPMHESDENDNFVESSLPNNSETRLDNPSTFDREGVDDQNHTVFENDYWLLKDVEQRLATTPYIIPSFHFSEAGKESAYHLRNRLIEENGISDLSLDQYRDIIKNKLILLMK